MVLSFSRHLFLRVYLNAAMANFLRGHVEAFGILYAEPRKLHDDNLRSVVLVAPNGLGKTMIVKNLTYHAIVRGATARFTTASDMLHELAARDSDASLARRLRRYTNPTLLCVDEVGYLNYDNRYADLLFEVVTRRYLQRPIIITNKAFSQWNEVFSSAGCVVTLVDRLNHRSEHIPIEADSYRLKEAKERTAMRRKARATRTKKTPRQT